MSNREQSFLWNQFRYFEHATFFLPIEMRAFWPCNSFLSPIVPGPNMPLPAPAPIPYSVPGPVQHHGYPSIISTNFSAVDSAPPSYNAFRGGVRSSVHTQSRIVEYQRSEDDRTNGMSDNAGNAANEQVQHQYGLDGDIKEPNSSPRGSVTVNSSDDSEQLNNMPLGFSAARFAGDGSSNESSPVLCSGNISKLNASLSSDAAVFNSDGTVTVSQSKYNELTRLALRGSEIAEKLAYTHRNRPCFKKIDSLCARMKQDLIRPDGVLPNINSQGIAWAIKDLIFVFTRIISAWIIIKGYVFNTPEGLNKVKAALCPDFVTRFLIWQDATYDFAESLVRSFVSLDNLVQSQKTAHQKSTDNLEINVNSPPKAPHSGNNSLFDDKFDFFDNHHHHAENIQPIPTNNLNNNYLYTMVKDSENSQREATVNGTYFKTGTYKPIKKDSYRNEYTASNSPEKDIQQLSCIAEVDNSSISISATPVALSTFVSNEINIPPPQVVTTDEIMNSNEMPIEYFDEDLYHKLVTGEIDIPMVEQCLRERLPNNWLDYGTRMFWRMFAERALHPTPNSMNSSSFVQSSSCILPMMVDRLMAMRSSDLFFKLQFSKNYFPKFIAKYEDKLTDLRTIVLKSQVNEYAHIYEMVHDVRRIFFYAKIYLEFNIDPDLVKAVNEFEIEFDNLLHDEPFNLFCYDHIVGDPRESLYLPNVAK